LRRPFNLAADFADYTEKIMSGSKQTPKGSAAFP
jgi:hypothetical protein